MTTITLYFDNNDQIRNRAKLVGVRNATTLAEYGEPDHTHTVEVDRSTNADAIAAFEERSTLTYDVASDTLYDGDAAVTVQPDSEETTQRKQAQTVYDNLQTYLDLQSPSNAQTLQAVQLMARVVKAMVKRDYLT